MENKFKRFLSLVLAFVMVLGMMPATVFATETDEWDYYVSYNFINEDGEPVDAKNIGVLYLVEGDSEESFQTIDSDTDFMFKPYTDFFTWVIRPIDQNYPDGYKAFEPVYFVVNHETGTVSLTDENFEVIEGQTGLKEITIVVPKVDDSDDDEWDDTVDSEKLTLYFNNYSDHPNENGIYLGVAEGDDLYMRFYDSEWELCAEHKLARTEDPYIWVTHEVEAEDLSADWVQVFYDAGKIGTGVLAPPTTGGMIYCYSHAAGNMVWLDYASGNYPKPVKTVNTEEELRAALAVGGEIVLGADIMVYNQLVIDKSVKIIGNGYAVSGTYGLNNMFLVQHNTAERISVEMENLTIVPAQSNRCIQVNSGLVDLKLTDCKMQGEASYAQALMFFIFDGNKPTAELNNCVIELPYGLTGIFACGEPTVTVNGGSIYAKYVLNSGTDSHPQFVLNNVDITTEKSVVEAQGSLDLTINGGDIEGTENGDWCLVNLVEYSYDPVNWAGTIVLNPDSVEENDTFSFSNKSEYSGTLEIKVNEGLRAAAEAVGFKTEQDGELYKLVGIKYTNVTVTVNDATYLLGTDPEATEFTYSTDVEGVPPLNVTYRVVRSYTQGEYKVYVTVEPMDGYKFTTKVGYLRPVSGVAKIGDVHYATLAEAVKAANAAEGGATVELLENVTLGEMLTISGNVTIEGAYTITRAVDYTGNLFTVNKGAELTLDDVTVDGANPFVLDQKKFDAIMAGEASFARNSKDSYPIVFNDELPVAQSYMFINNGTINLTNATIQNHFGVRFKEDGTYWPGVDVFNFVNGSSLTMDGSTIKDCATNDAGAIFNVEQQNVTITMKNGSTITNNYGVTTGAIVRINTSNITFVMENSSITGNYCFGNVGVVYATGNSSVTLRDSAITNNKGTTSYALNMRSASTLTVEGKSAISGNRYGVSLWNGSASVKLGEDVVVENNGFGLVTYVDCSFDNNVTFNDNVYVGSGSMTISNGTWKGSFTVVDGASLTLTGGTFYQDVQTWCADGYYARDNGDGTWDVIPQIAVTLTVNNATKVAGEADPVFTASFAPEVVGDYTITYTREEGETEGTYAINATVEIQRCYKVNVVPGTLTIEKAVNYVAEIVETGVKYGSLAEAVKAAGKDAATIKLLVPELTERATVGHSFVQNITIDLNGGKLSSNDTTLIANRNGTVLTLVNGTVYGNSNNGGTVRASGGGKLILGEGVVITSGPHANAIKVDNGTVVINEDIEVFGGANNKNWLVTSANTKNTVIVSKGFFTGGMSVGEGTNMQLSGGIYTVRPEDAWCVEGYEVKVYGKDLWTVGPVDGTITVDGVWFADWEAAEPAVTKNSVIKLYADQTNTQGTSAFVSKGNVTLDLNGHTLSSPYEKTAVNAMPVQYTNLYVVDSTGGGKLIGNDSHSLFAYIDGTVYFNDGVQFIGSLQSTNGKGTFYVGEQMLLGNSEDAIYQTSGTARIGMKENGDWTVSIGKLTMNADYAALANNTLTINKDCSIDLNGHALTAKNIQVKGNLIDTADGVGAVYAEVLSFNNHDNGGYLPLWDAENECYRLFETEVKVVGHKVKGDTLTFGEKIFFNKAEAYKLLAENTDNKAKLTVSCADNCSAPYTQEHDLLKEFAEAAKVQLETLGTVKTGMSFDGNGLGDHASGDVISAVPSVESPLGVVITGETYTYTVG